LGRILFWLLLAALAWWFVKGVLKSRLNEPKRPESLEAEDMVACARCGVNMPRSEAREDGGKFYCLTPTQCVK